MDALKIKLVCSTDAEEMTKIRIAIREAMMSMGRLPHWQERYEPVTKHELLPPILEVNGKVCWHKGDGDFPGPSKLPELINNASVNKRYLYRNRLRMFFSFAMTVIIALFPKCPFCWAAYVSILSAFGFEALPYQPWILPILIGLLTVNLLSMYITRRRHGDKLLFMAMSGAGVLLINKFTMDVQWLTWSGAVLVFVASLWNSVDRRVTNSLKYHLSRFYLKICMLRRI